MSLLKAVISIDEFNPKRDKIALMLKSFTIKMKDNGLFKKKKQYSEPYFVGLSITQNGIGNQQINFVTEPYPKTRRNDKRDFLAEGMRIYGPDNPGEFLVFHILVMESDSDIRETGSKIKAIMNSSEVKGTILPMLAVNPGIAIATEALSALTSIIARQMEQNKDDKCMLTTGTLMRDVMGSEDRPFRVGTVLADGNDMVDLELSILAISGNSRHQRKTDKVELVA